MRRARHIRTPTAASGAALDAGPQARLDGERAAARTRIRAAADHAPRGGREARRQGWGDPAGLGSVVRPDPARPRVRGSASLSRRRGRFATATRGGPGGRAGIHITGAVRRQCPHSPSSCSASHESRRCSLQNVSKSRRAMWYVGRCPAVTTVARSRPASICRRTHRACANPSSRAASSVLSHCERAM